MYFLIASIASAAYLVTAIAGVFCYRRLDKPARILAIYFIITAIFNPIQVYMARHDINTIRMYHFFSPMEYLFYVYAFSYWTGNIKLTKILRYSIIGFFILSAANSLRMPDINHFSFAALAIAYMVYVFISSLAVYNLIKGDTGRITVSPVFWLALSLLVISANNELWYAINESLPVSQLYIAICNIHNFVSILACLLSTVGFLLYRYPAKTDKAPEVSVYWN